MKKFILLLLVVVCAAFASGQDEFDSIDIMGLKDVDKMVVQFEVFGDPQYQSVQNVKSEINEAIESLGIEIMDPSDRNIEISLLEPKTVFVYFTIDMTNVEGLPFSILSLEVQVAELMETPRGDICLAVTYLQDFSMYAGEKKYTEAWGDIADEMARQIKSDHRKANAKYSGLSG